MLELYSQSLFGFIQILHLKIRLLDDHVVCHCTSYPYIRQTHMGDHHAGVILVYKELTTSVVPKYTDSNKTWSDLLIFTQYMLHLRFIRTEIPSGTIHVGI